MAQPKSFLDGLQAKDIAGHEITEKQFKKSFMSIHKASEEDANAFYETQKTYFNQTIADEKTYIAQCTPVSIFSAFLEIAIQGLSIKKQSQAEAYVGKTSTKVGEAWINTAQLVIQAHGELALRVRAGQLVHPFIPVVVYECDLFQPRTNDKGELCIEYLPTIPRASNVIKACYVRLALRGGLNDFKFLLKEDIERLHKTSMKFLKNDKGNGLYSSGEDGQIDVGFLATKTLKHAFSTLPRLKLSSGAIFEEEVITEENKNESFDNGQNIAKPEPTKELFPDAKKDSPF